MIIETVSVLLGILLGGMIYVTFLIAPIIFIVLEDPEATQFTRKLWPRYFIINGLIAFIIGFTAFVGTTWLASSILILTVSGFMAINWGCAKRMQAMREPGSDYVKGSNYDWLHKITVWTNGLSILLLTGIELYYIGFQITS